MAQNPFFGQMMSSVQLTNFHACHPYSLHTTRKISNVEDDEDMPLGEPDDNEITNISCDIETTWSEDNHFHTVISNINSEGDIVRKAVVLHLSLIYIDSAAGIIDPFDVNNPYDSVYMLTMGVKKIKGPNKDKIILDGVLPPLRIPDGFPTMEDEIPNAAAIWFFDDDDNAIDASKLPEEIAGLIPPSKNSRRVINLTGMWEVVSQYLKNK